MAFDVFAAFTARSVELAQLAFEFAHLLLEIIGPRGKSQDSLLPGSEFRICGISFHHTPCGKVLELVNSSFQMPDLRPQLLPRRHVEA